MHTFVDHSLHTYNCLLTSSCWLHAWRKHRHISYTGTTLQSVRWYLIQARFVVYVDCWILFVSEIYVVLQRNHDKPLDVLCKIILLVRTTEGRWQRLYVTPYTKLPMKERFAISVLNAVLNFLLLDSVKSWMKMLRLCFQPFIPSLFSPQSCIFGYFWWTYTARVTDEFNTQHDRRTELP